MVAAFMALLKVALIMAVLGHTPALPFGGVTRITVGGVVGGVAIPLLSGSPHPMAKPINRSAVNPILCLLCVRMRASSFLGSITIAVACSLDNISKSVSEKLSKSAHFPISN